VVRALCSNRKRNVPLEYKYINSILSWYQNPELCLKLYKLHRSYPQFQNNFQVWRCNSFGYAQGTLANAVAKVKSIPSLKEILQHVTGHVARAPQVTPLRRTPCIIQYALLIISVHACPSQLPLPSHTRF
jgi:hypothetical protein